jgi:hypothetical protein
MMAHIFFFHVVGYLGGVVLFWFLFISGTGSHEVSWARTHSGLELSILLALSPKCWDYRPAPPHPASPYLLQEKQGAWGCSSLVKCMLKLWAQSSALKK